MISYTLKCAQDHQFTSWFQSAAAYDRLRAAGMIACTVCGATEVDKTLMAPQVRASRDRADAPDGDRPLSQPLSPAEQALAGLKKKIRDNAEYVGTDFAREARDIHAGHRPDRPIYGEARPDEAKKLVEDGIPVVPLPFMPERNTN